jgi:pimeloyl-ACP methyl ester carboxylesterase
MTRFLAFLLLLAGAMAPCAALASPPAPIDQAGWSARKQSVLLPNGVRLAYVEMGDPNGSPVLLLHGWTDSSRVWTILAPQLMKHRLLVPDQRGHGASDRPECCYALADLAYDAKLFLDAMKVERAGVVGHSLGSMVGQRLAAEHPERVERLVLIGSTVLVPVRRGDWLWTEVNGLSHPMAVDSPFMRAWSPSASPTPVDGSYLAHADRETVAVPRQVWLGVARELVDVPVGNRAADIRAPTLILSGGKDPLFPPDHHAALVRAFPHARAHVFPELGHNLVVERPDEVGPRLAAFLAAPGG